MAVKALSPRGLAIAAGALVVVTALAGFVVFMSQTVRMRTATTKADLRTLALAEPGETVCQPRLDVLAGTGFVAPDVSGPQDASSGGPFEVAVEADGRTVATAESPGGRPAGRVTLPLDPAIDRRLRDARVCFRNTGREQLRFAAYTSADRWAAEAPAFQHGMPGTIWIDWYHQERRTRWQLVGAVAERFALFKGGPLGPWTFYFVVVVLVALSLFAVIRVTREARP